MNIKEEMEIANKKAHKRIPKRNAPVVPKHIIPLYNDTFRGWGMFNTRLQAWAGEVDEFGDPANFYKTEDQAINWYLEQM